MKALSITLLSIAALLFVAAMTLWVLAGYGVGNAGGHGTAGMVAFFSSLLAGLAGFFVATEVDS